MRMWGRDNGIDSWSASGLTREWERGYGQNVMKFRSRIRGREWNLETTVGRVLDYKLQVVSVVAKFGR